ncbi:MAG: hypothetical protein UH851_02350 [Clostridia bacterium]|nr:hypothetical protein [Clostridia bacterium]
MKIFSKILCIILVLATVVTLFASCATPEGNSESESTTETKQETIESGSETETETETDPIKLYHDTYGWIAVPMVTQEQLDKGYTGGEACQAVNYVYFVESDPTGQIAFIGTDVGDIYRSTDGGNNWEPCALGMEASGGTAFEADPKNPNRILVLGTNAGQHGPNIIYISEDAGVTWKGCTFESDPESPSGFRDSRDQIAFDPTSYDESLGYCKTVYWSRGWTDNLEKNGIYVSYDGGYTWAIMKDTSTYANGYLAVNQSGDIICANDKGVYLKKSGQNEFELVIDKHIYAMDFVPSKNVGYCNTVSQLYKTVDGGLTWTIVSPTRDQYVDKTLWKFKDITNPQNIRVSPVNTDNLIVFDDRAGSSKQSWYSHDGGVTWNICSKSLEGQWIPDNTDYNKFSWSPVDENTVITTWTNICKSTDGGKTFKWSCAGYNGICVGSMMNINTINSDYLSYGSQDYNGGFSVDGGKTWKYMKWLDRSWGGFCYGSYALNDKVVVGGSSDGSVSEGKGNPYICMTFDGGETFVNTEHKVHGVTIGCGSIHDENIAFFGEYRTEDGGKTWTKMDNCVGVFTVDYKTGALFGVKRTQNSTIVVSTDEGKTWKNVVTFGGIMGDIAFDHNSRKIYYTAGSDRHSANNYTLYSITVDENYVATEKPNIIDIGDTNSKTGYDGALTVAVDPNHPEIVYVGCGSTYYFEMKCIWRSMDSGETWECLSRQIGDGFDGFKDGGIQPRCIRVAKNTGELFVFTACRGVWKISGPVSVYGENK